MLILSIDAKDMHLDIDIDMYKDMMLDVRLDVIIDIRLDNEKIMKKEE